MVTDPSIVVQHCSTKATEKGKCLEKWEPTKKAYLFDHVYAGLKFNLQN